MNAPPRAPANSTGLPSLWALEGHWTLERRITHTEGRTDHFEGVAVFSRSGPRLLQHEQGRLTVGNQVFEAEQRYVWAEAEGRIDVYFADLRPFHAVPLNDPAPSTVHLCDPDRYEVAYDFAEWPVWSATWTVEGPRKGYVMHSTYRRSSD